MSWVGVGTKIIKKSNFSIVQTDPKRKRLAAAVGLLAISSAVSMSVGPASLILNCGLEMVLNCMKFSRCPLLLEKSSI